MNIKNKFTVLYILILAYYVSSVFFIRNGLFTPDTVGQYTQYIMHSYNDWHPPVMSLWWNLFNLIGAVFNVHLFLFVIGVVIFIRAFQYQNNFKAALFVFILLMCPMISFGMYKVLKDMGMFAALTCASALLFYSSNSALRIKYIVFIFSLPLFFYAISIRYNAILAVLPLIVYSFVMIAKSFKGRLLAILLSLSTVLFMLYLNKFVTYHIFDATKSHPEIVTISYDLAAIDCSYNSEHFISQPVFKGLTKQKVCDTLTYKTSDPILHIINSGDVDINELQHQWFSTIISHPIAYLIFRAKVFAYSLVSNGWSIPANDIIVNGQEIHLTHNDLFYKITTMAYKVNGAILTNFMGFGIFCLILSFLFAIVLIKGKVYKQNLFLVCLYLSGVIYYLAYFIVLPAPDSRYFIWYYVTTFLSWIIYLSNNKQITLPRL